MTASYRRIDLSNDRNASNLVGNKNLNRRGRRVTPPVHLVPLPSLLLRALRQVGECYRRVLQAIVRHRPCASPACCRRRTLSMRRLSTMGLTATSETCH
eukprot:1181526-Prorocentrum_minimum.AAC.1